MYEKENHLVNIKLLGNRSKDARTQMAWHLLFAGVMWVKKKYRGDKKDGLVGPKSL